MRRLLVLVAICVGCPTWAVAGQFDQLSNRLKQYDEQNTALAQTPTREYIESNNNSDPPPNFSPAGDPYQGDGGWGGGPPCGDGCCGDCGGCGGCGGCGFNPCGNCCGFWGRAEYLLWWVRGSNTPALVTTSPDGTPSGVAGVLPGANVLFGDQRINNTSRSGGRFTVGYWFGDTGLYSLEDTFFFVGGSSDGFKQTSNGSPILARPFFNTLTSAQDSVLVAFPNTVVGTIAVSSSRQLYGNELNLRRALYADNFRRFDILAGYRFLYLSDGLQVTTNTTSTDQGGTVPVGTTFGVFDSFATRNQFNGGQIGLSTEFYDGRWSLSLRGKIALGGVSQHVSINGGTVTTEPGQSPVSNTGGILALNSNIGNYHRSQFGVLPEFGVDLHYQLTPLWRVNVGYTIMGLTNVVRPGDQIDTNLNPNLFPPPVGSGSQPSFAFHNSDLLIQGLNVGIEANF